MITCQVNFYPSSFRIEAQEQLKSSLLTIGINSIKLTLGGWGSNHDLYDLVCFRSEAVFPGLVFQFLWAFPGSPSPFPWAFHWKVPSCENVEINENFYCNDILQKSLISAEIVAHQGFAYFNQITMQATILLCVSEWLMGLSSVTFVNCLWTRFRSPVRQKTDVNGSIRSPGSFLCPSASICNLQKLSSTVNIPSSL